MVPRYLYSSRIGINMSASELSTPMMSECACDFRRACAWSRFSFPDIPIAAHLDRPTCSSFKTHHFPKLAIDRARP